MIASVPPHLASDEDREKPPKIEDLLIDTGCSTETARQRFAPGDLITLDGHFTLMNEKYLVSNALDDRIGCVSVIAAAEELHRLQPGWEGDGAAGLHGGDWRRRRTHLRFPSHS